MEAGYGGKLARHGTSQRAWWFWCGGCKLGPSCTNAATSSMLDLFALAAFLLNLSDLFLFDGDSNKYGQKYHNDPVLSI